MNRDTANRIVWRRGLSIILAIVVMSVIACAGDPVAQVAKARGEYDVRLTSFLPQYPEPLVMDFEEGEEAIEAAATAAEVAVEAEDGVEGEGEEAEMAPEPGPIDVLFDLVIKFEGAKSLPGLTIDVIQQDASGTEKARRRHYVETPGIRRGSDQQVAFTLDNVDFAEGDSFGVAVPAVSEADRASLREFMEAGGQ